MKKPPPPSLVAAAFARTLNSSSPAAWSNAIADLSRSGDHSASLAAFAAMRRLNHLPDRSSFAPAIRSAAATSAFLPGAQLHSLALRLGLFPSDPFIASSLIHLYSRCRNVSSAFAAFTSCACPNHIVYTAMISGCVFNGLAFQGIALFSDLVAEFGVTAVDAAAAVTVLSAAARANSKSVVRALHCLVVKIGVNAVVGVGNVLVDAYGKGAGELGVAREVFDGLPEKDVVSWNEMISLYAKSGHAEQALRAYGMMLEAGVAVNAVTLSTVLLAIAGLGAVQTGKRVHTQVVRMALERHVIVGTSVVDMYCKCGKVEMARAAFDQMDEKNVLTWSAMIAGYGIHGHGQDALELFDEMRRAGVRPNYITFVSVLTACSHAGLLHDGRHWFSAMKEEYDIEPGLEHYGSMVDLLGRAGHLNEAYGLIKDMKIRPDSVVWGALLSACRLHKCVELGEISAKKLYELEPTNCGYYVLLSNMYANAGMWKDVEKMRVLIKRKRLMKPPGYSSVELRGTTYVFLIGDRRHPQHKEIYAYLQDLFVRMQEAGYTPDTGSVLHDVDEEEKETVLNAHSEKLAVAFAVMSTAPGTTIHVIKNLRMCGDCHSAIKLIAKLVDRKIIIRDSQRFHHFENGLCSCRDYW